MKSRKEKKRKITAYLRNDNSGSSSPKKFENNNETTTGSICNDWEQFLEKAATLSQLPAQR